MKGYVVRESLGTTGLAAFEWNAQDLEIEK